MKPLHARYIWPNKVLDSVEFRVPLVAPEHPAAIAAAREMRISQGLAVRCPEYRAALADLAIALLEMRVAAVLAEENLGAPLDSPSD